MNKHFCPFRNCLFEKSVRKVKLEYVKGVEYERSSSLIQSVMGNIVVTIHYLPWFPPRIVIDYEFTKDRIICLYSDSWVYSNGVEADNYQDMLDYYFSELEDDDRFKE
jgi:hypothetical protein